MDGMCTAAFSRAVGVSYRVVDYWARTETLRPSLIEAKGSGSVRRYSPGDVAVGRVLAHLTRHGARRQVLATVAARLAGLPEPWAGYLTVTADGAVAWWPSLPDIDGVEAAWLVRLGVAETEAAA